jgi:aldose 1-epimerase
MISMQGAAADGRGAPGAISSIRDQRFLLVAPSGIAALVSSWGANLIALSMPDRNGRFADVVLGFDTAADYLAQANIYFGCTVGRVANRIRGAEFRLGAIDFHLARNDGPHHLHGGATRSFDRVDWSAQRVAAADGEAVSFRYVSPDGEEGYPGTLDTTVTYTLTRSDELRIDYLARTDRTTPVNLTNHTYWNLARAGHPTVLDHELQVHADLYTPTDLDLIPLGSIEPVAGTALDLRKPATLGARIAELEPGGGRGYDHNYVLPEGRPLTEPVARLRDPASGRVVEVITDQPCLQVYSGNLMVPTVGKGGVPYPRRSAVCLEPQATPDAVHNPAFGSILLEPGDTYRRSITFRMRRDGLR